MQGYDDAWFLVRMSAAQLDELAAAASTAPCQTRAQSRRREPSI